MIISLKKKLFFDLSQIQLTDQISNIKNNTNIEHRSSLERDFVYYLEYSSEIKYYIEQPIIIKYIANKKQKITHIPSFYIEYYNGEKEITDIIMDENCLTNKSKCKKSQIIKELCTKNNLKYRILNENNIQMDLLFNAKFLLYYRHPIKKVNRGDFRLLLDKMKEAKRISVKELINISSSDNIIRAELLYVLWYIVARGFISYSETSKLTMDTILWIEKYT